MLYQLSYLGGKREWQKTKRVEKRASRRKHRQQQIRKNSRKSSGADDETEKTGREPITDPKNIGENPTEMRINFVDG